MSTDFLEGTDGGTAYGTDSSSSYSVFSSRTSTIFSGAKNQRFSEQPPGLLRWNGVDIELRAPFKADDLGEFGHNLDVPVVEIIQSFDDWRDPGKTSYSLGDNTS